MTEQELTELDKLTGTTLGGSRLKGRFTLYQHKVPVKNRPYYHADVGAAANHIQALGEAIQWTKEKKHKLCTPLKFQVLKILDQKIHGVILGLA